MNASLPTRLPSRRRCLQTGIASAMLGLAGLLSAGSAFAQEWPTKPVRIVLAIAPGSTGDTLARMMAPRLEALWKQPVIVENKPGAGGVVGTEYVVRATDGHTLLLGTQSSILPKYTQKGLRFDPLTDLVAVRKVLHYQLLIAANEETARKARTLRDLVALSKTTDKGLFLAGTGPTSIFNLSFAILNKQLGIRYEAVNFNSVPAMNMAVLRGDAQFVVNTPASLKSHMDTGALVALGAVNAKRYPNLPDVPTLQEAAGYTGYLPQLWHGFFVPKGTPPEVTGRVYKDVETIFGDEAFRKQVETSLAASFVTPASPTSFAKDLQEETGLWQDLFQTLNIKPE
ncbi:Bug family tripartite tricarboxylate transporter substrate binding protein [Alicycliphilus denitrificans]|uniref:Tripartite tricarboxylate transporter substrate binding protein n=1 Tax=Alicycliphilus denitrificans TaxID=179636 RepID=A0A3R7HMG1_9BURK|nr:tripartite tricarboxylate transporter substrate binding protein [Alicycliphilus denitrificans]RKJ95133.1 tripartite tricarboxylate transporter substrate binding protein [Alicycliphilus denitrificans]